MSIKDIFQSGKDVISKMKGGVAIVGDLGERILAAKDASELPEEVKPEPGTLFNSALVDVYNWTGSQSLPSSSTFFNFLTLTGIVKNPASTAGTVLASNKLTFPVRNKNSIVVFSIRMNGTIAGGAGVDREWKIQTRRPDGTLLGSDFAVKVVDETSISNRDTTLSSYTLGNTDPFFVDGVTVGVLNDSGQTMTITSVSIRILQTINPE